MATNDPPPRPQTPTPRKPTVPAEIIPPDPDPPDPERAPPSTKPPKPAKRTGRDKTRESHPDFGDVRRVPRKSDPPIITSRRSSRFDSSSTHSVGPASLAGYDMLLSHDLIPSR